MHARRLKTFAIATVAAVAATVGMSAPAAAEGAGDPPVGDDGSNLTGRVGEQIDTINSGSPGGGASEPPTCTWHELKDGEVPDPYLPKDEDPAYEEREGTLEWVEPLRGHGVWEESDLAEGEGTFFRYQCWHDDMAEDCPYMSTDDERCMGYDATENFCDTVVCEFDAINPRNLALYLVDEFVEALPAPSPQFNPPGGTTYVNFDTWMWVDDIPNNGSMPVESISVPGLTVHTTAELSNVNWTMGDGGSVDCPLTVDESSAEAECSYAYVRSSANQPNNTYTGEASTVWEAEWTVEQNGQSGTVDAPRSTDFELQVAEVQTVNR